MPSRYPSDHWGSTPYTRGLRRKVSLVGGVVGHLRIDRSMWELMRSETDVGLSRQKFEGVIMDGDSLLPEEVDRSLNATMRPTVTPTIKQKIAACISKASWFGCSEDGSFFIIVSRRLSSPTPIDWPCLSRTGMLLVAGLYSAWWNIVRKTDWLLRNVAFRKRFYFLRGQDFYADCPNRTRRNVWNEKNAIEVFAFLDTHTFAQKLSKDV